MDRGAWWATIHGVSKVQTQRVTKHSTAAMGYSPGTPEISFTIFGN